MQISGTRSYMEQNGNKKNRKVNKEVMVKIVILFIISKTVRFFKFDKVNKCKSRRNEENFENSIVKRNVIKEEIHVPGGKHH